MQPTSATRQPPAVGPTCSLDSAGLAKRVEQWRSLRADALITEATDDGVTVCVFTRSEEAMRRLRDLIAAEAACCSVDFRVHEDDDTVTVEVASGRSPTETGTVAGW